MKQTMSKLRFASRTLSIALILVAFHFLILAIKPCIKGHTPCEASMKASSKEQRNAEAEGDDKRFQWDKGFPPLSTSYISDSLKPRHSFKSYEEYIDLQLKKTMNPQLRKLWTSKDWRRKVDVFSLVFQNLMKTHVLKLSDKALCIAARVGQEVLALKEMGVNDSIGLDLVASPPLVIKGDMHRLPFDANTFDFVFSNAFDHALFPAMFAAEVERTLKPGGIAALHVPLKTRPDKYSANDLLNIDALLHLFKNFDVVHVTDVDTFGLDSEVVLRKRVHQREKQGDIDVKGMVNKCSSSKLKQEIIDSAESLIIEEPIKPWITLKENAKNIRYLPSLINMNNYSKYVYIDVGARSFSSSIGSWFTKKYPNQNHDFSIYAIEADRAFAKEYAKHKKVHFLPYAAWVRNETLMFGANPENRTAEGDIGMGRIQRQLSEGDNDKDVSMGSQSRRIEKNRSRKGDVGTQLFDKDTNKDVSIGISQSRRSEKSLSAQEELQMVQGFDFAEWLMKTVSEDDYVVMKMDIEGTEFDLLPRMLGTGAICLVDELFLECHYNRWQRTSSSRTSKYKSTYDECLSLFQALRRNGVLVHQWW